MNNSTISESNSRIYKPVIYPLNGVDASNTLKYNGNHRIIKISKSCFQYLVSAFKSVVHQLSKIIKKVIPKHSSSETKKKTEEQFKKIISDKGKFKSAGLSEEKVKKLVRKGMKQDLGTHELMTYKGKKILVSTITDPKMHDKAVAIHVISKNIFQFGSFGEIRGAISLGTNERVAEKLASDLAGDKALTDIQNEYKILTELHEEGHKKGIQAPPHTAVTDKNKDVVGYIGRRYDGDGLELIRLIDDKQYKGFILDMIHSLNTGLLTIWNKGFFHGDHKAENTLYSIKDGKFDLVVSDLGGDIKRSKFKDLLKNYAGIKKEIKELTLENDQYKTMDAVIDALVTCCGNLENDIIGVYTPGTTCNEDITKQRNLIQRFGNKNISLEKCLNQLEKFAEARVVFSQALVTTCLLTGKDTSSCKEDTELFTPEILPRFRNKEEFKTKLDKIGLKVKLSDSQYTTLYEALQEDYSKRPSLQKFAQDFEAGITTGLPV